MLHERKYCYGTTILLLKYIKGNNKKNNYLFNPTFLAIKSIFQL